MRVAGAPSSPPIDTVVDEVAGSNSMISRMVLPDSSTGGSVLGTPRLTAGEPKTAGCVGPGQSSDTVIISTGQATPVKEKMTARMVDGRILR